MIMGTKIEPIIELIKIGPNKPKTSNILFLLNSKFKGVARSEDINELANPIPIAMPIFIIYVADAPLAMPPIKVQTITPR